MELKKVMPSTKMHRLGLWLPWVLVFKHCMTSKNNKKKNKSSK